MELQYYYFRLIYEYCIVFIVSRFIGSTIAEERLVSVGAEEHGTLRVYGYLSGRSRFNAQRLVHLVGFGRGDYQLERIELVADPHAVPRTKRGSASNVTMDCSCTRSVVCRFCYSIGHLSSQYYF